MKPRTPKPIAPEKLTVLLLKLRKCADAAITLPQLFQVLTHIGGFTTKPCVGVVKRGADGRYQGTDKALAEAEHARITAAVTPWPTDGVEVDAAFYADVEPLESWERGGITLYTFHYREGVGATGVEVATEAGPSASFFPSWYGSKPRVYPSDILGWLKAETDYLDRVSAALGMELHVPAAERTLENTGSCPCCFRNIKLDHHDEGGVDVPTMVLHGYQRPGNGSVEGECLGRRRKPFEVSAEGTILLLGITESQRARAAAYLASLRAGEETQILQGQKMLTPTSAEWGQAVLSAIARVENEVRGLTSEIALLSWLIDTWKACPLPKPGERIRPWRLEAWKAIRRAEVAAKERPAA